jgi:hypothetical protein
VEQQEASLVPAVPFLFHSSCWFEHFGKDTGFRVWLAASIPVPLSAWRNA